MSYLLYVSDKQLLNYFVWYYMYPGSLHPDVSQLFDAHLTHPLMFNIYLIFWSCTELPIYG